MEDYIELLRKEFYNNSDFNNCINCKAEIHRPKYKELLFGFVFGGRNKQMVVYNNVTKTRISY